MTLLFCLIILIFELFSYKISVSKEEVGEL